MRPKIAQGVLQDAARWQARLQAEDCSDSDRQAFDRWRQENAEHGEAVARARQIFATFDAASTDVRLQALTQEAFAAYENVNLPARRRWAVPLAMAASVAICALALNQLIDRAPVVPTVVYETTASGRRTVTLDEGSLIEMDIGTRVAVRLSSAERAIELQSGRAIFDVANDVQRPFTVTAGPSRTTALGTRFQVQEEEGRVIVTLQEGSVLVEGEESAQHSRWEERLAPGQQVSIDEQTAPARPRIVDPAAVTSWSQGRHMFRETPLDQVLLEVNRYATKKIRLGDPALAGLAVGGNFIAGDSEQIVAALAAVLPVRIVRGGDDEIILLPDFRAHGVR